MSHDATSDSDNPSGGVELPIGVHDEADSVATEDSSCSGAIALRDEADSNATEDPSLSTDDPSLSTTANGSSVNIPILLVNDRIHKIQPEVLANGLPPVIPSWLKDFEFFYNTADLTLPESSRLLMEEEGKPCFARLTIRGECILSDLEHAKGILQRCDLEKVTKFSLEEGVLECGEAERAKLELGNRVYVGSTVLLLRVLEETTLDSGWINDWLA